MDLKDNIPKVLRRELRKKPKGQVGISTVTDAYQPLERKYEVTRRCLEQLLKRDFPICIQTKSDLVLRDIDLIKEFSDKEVGFTITTLDDEARKKYEPGASPIGDRISAIGEIASEGIDTWAFIGPIMPYITEVHLDDLVGRLADVGVGSIMVEKLRMKPGLERGIQEFYSENYPDLLSRIRELDESYYNDVKRHALRLSKKYGIPCESRF